MGTRGGRCLGLYSVQFSVRRGGRGLSESSRAELLPRGLVLRELSRALLGGCGATPDVPLSWAFAPRQQVPHLPPPPARGLWVVSAPSTTSSSAGRCPAALQLTGQPKPRPEGKAPSAVGFAEKRGEVAGHKKLPGLVLGAYAFWCRAATALAVLLELEEAQSHANRPANES